MIANTIGEAAAGAEEWTGTEAGAGAGTRKGEAEGVIELSRGGDVSEQFSFLHPDEGTPAAEALEANANIQISNFDKRLRLIKGIKHPKLKPIRTTIPDRKFSRNFKGKTIEGIHEQYTLTIGMMLGIRVAVRLCALLLLLLLLLLLPLPSLFLLLCTALHGIF
jgi:hypothetical protein